MDPVDGLRELGFTRYEAMVYTALVKHPGSTGYEVSKHSGVPRGKVYEVLEGMTQRGSVLVTHEDDRQLYGALPHDLLLDRHRSRVEDVVDELRETLGALESLPPENPMSTLRGHQSIMQRAREMCAGAARSVLVTGFTPELMELREELQERERGGTRTYALIYGDEDLGIGNQYNHFVSPLQHRQVARFGRWLAVIKDMDEALLAQVRNDGTTALWTSNMGVVLALAMWIQHDITLSAMSAEVGPEMAIEINNKMQANTALTDLWELVLRDRREDG